MKLSREPGTLWRAAGAARAAASAAIALLALPACADTAACDAVFAAMAKLVGTPNHQFISTTRLGKTTQGETVTLGGTRWVLAAGRWRSHPYDIASETRDLRATRSGKESCARVRSEAVDGEAATLFSMHNPSDDGTSDAQVWISNARGLPLRQTIDIPEVKTHIEVRSDYAHVQPPAAP